MPLSPSRMFYRLLLRAATVRRGRTLTALFALAVAACLGTALLNLYSDIGAKLSGDFRRFGANVILSSSQGLSDVDLQHIREQAATALMMPEALAAAKTTSGHSVIVVGTDFDIAPRMDAWWGISRWPSAAGEALMGGRIPGVEGKQTLDFNGKHFEVLAVGQLHTGGDEDNRLYISLRDLEAWTGLHPTVVEMQIPGSPSEVTTTIAHMQNALPRTLTIQPVRQITEAETKVLGKTRSILLLSTIAITLTVALCVLATLTASVLERKKDYAVMKALGSSQWRLNAIFLGEAFSLATAGAIIGFAAGCGLAMWIGRANFQAAVEPRLSLFPAVFAGCAIIAAISAVLPLGLLQETEPAAMLKGE